MTALRRLIDCAVAHIAARRGLVAVDPRRVVLCLTAMSPAADLEGQDIDDLARAVVHAVATGRTAGLGLPGDVAAHIARWIDPATRLQYRLHRRWLYRARLADLDGFWGRN